MKERGSTHSLHILNFNKDRDDVEKRVSARNQPSGSFSKDNGRCNGWKLPEALTLIHL